MRNHKLLRLGRLGWLLFVVVVPLVPILLLPNLAIATPAINKQVHSTVVTPTIQMTHHVVQHDVKRLGINVGVHNQYGASQLFKNVIVNPGLEAGEFATLVIPHSGATTDRVQADNYFGTWDRDLVLNHGSPIGFWNDAQFEVIYGDAHGESGRVISYTHESDLATYHLDGLSVAPSANDVIAFRQNVTGTVAGASVKGTHEADTTEIRPNSPGSQSLKLLSAPPGPDWDYSYRYFMDSYWSNGGDPTARKMLVMDGEWMFSFWARTVTETEQLNIQFMRRAAGHAPESTFIDLKVPIDTTWQLYTHTFSVANGGDPFDGYSDNDPHPLLELNLFLESDSDPIWIDDLSLFRTDEVNPTAFSDAMVETLKGAQPGILRNWGENLLGNSLDNQLADPFARKTSGYSPDASVPQLYHYSLHEFLELAQEVGSEPWYVIPPTWSNAEMENLVAYLSAPTSSNHPYAEKRMALGQAEPWTDVFETIHLEFGNEMWGAGYGGDPFWGATVRGGFRVGSIANERFATAKASPHWDSAEFNIIIGGQHGYPPQNQQIQDNSTAHDSVALAPYFGELNAWGSDEEMYMPLYARSREDVTAGKVYNTHNILNDDGRDTELSIYEINFHTTLGSVPNEIRNDFVTGLNGGLALPLYMLTYARDLGARNQAAFQLAQFSKSIWVSTARSATPDWYHERLSKLEYDPLATKTRSTATGYNEFVRIWGLTHDLKAAQRKRPTMLGLELTNAAMNGSMVQVNQTHVLSYTQVPTNGVITTMTMPYIESFAFMDGIDRSLLMFNLHLSDAQTVVLDLPEIPLPQGELTILTADSIHDDNEIEENVRVTTQTLAMSDGMTLTLPANSLVSVSWQFGLPSSLSAVNMNSAHTTSAHAPILLLVLTLFTTLTVTLVWQVRRS